MLLLLLGTAFAEERLIDLTWPFDEHTVYWPTATPFSLRVVHKGPTEAVTWYEANEFTAAEHGGTHVDAPVHFAQGKWTVDQIPLDALTGPAVVVDISGRAANDPDTQLLAKDLQVWEFVNGEIPAGSILLVRTGWGARWGDKKAYLGTDAPGDVANLHFPGIHPDAARWLVENRQVTAVGIDTPSLDTGQSKDFGTHVVLFEHNVPGLENVAHLESLPAVGATLTALPMLIAGGSGAPCRIVATVP